MRAGGQRDRAGGHRDAQPHIRHVLGKLDMPDGENDHRRVLAVLAHLDATRG